VKRLVALSAVLAVSGAHAATPCDFKGLSVGDKATPQQIMTHFGTTKYIKNGDDSPTTTQTKEQKEAVFNARMKRAQKVSMINEAEEEEEKAGPACGHTYCRIPYHYVHVGEEPYSIPVGVYVSFDSTGKVTAIDVSYDKIQWDDVLELLNTKYGENWRREDTQDVTTDYETKKSEPETVTVLTHRNNGTNPKTGDKCVINTRSRDIIWLHTTPPIHRAVMEIRLVSKNF
jgi:hypothetical protein